MSVTLPSPEAAATAHIHLDDRGVAWIDDRNVKVIEVALDMIAHGATAEQICKMHGKYLSSATSMTFTLRSSIHATPRSSK